MTNMHVNSVLPILGLMVATGILVTTDRSMLILYTAELCYTLQSGHIHRIIARRKTARR